MIAGPARPVLGAARRAFAPFAPEAIPTTLAAAAAPLAPARPVDETNKIKIRIRVRRLLAALLLLCLVALGAAVARAEEPAAEGVSFGLSEGTDVLTLGAGAFDFNDEDSAGEVRAEYRFIQRPLGLTPLIGIQVNTDGGVFGYGGFGYDVYFGRHFVVTPQATMGGYDRGQSKDLGGVFQFRTGVEFAYRFDNRYRVGIALHHISNAGIHDENPGTNILVLTVSMPLLAPR